MKTHKPKFKKRILALMFFSCFGNAQASNGSTVWSALFHPKHESDKPVNPYTSPMWDTMSRDFTMDHEVDRQQVNAQIAVLQKNKLALYRTLKEVAPLISYVYQQTKQRGLPAELALLPMVESKFNPLAKSPVGASGLWQIMPKTAPDLGLKNNAAYDGRRDMVASTGAALGYLNTLNKMFNKNWNLALAAYNYGPGNVQKVVKNNSIWFRSVNFWTLKLPKETTDYIPKLLALAAVVKNPERYGIQLPNVASEPQLVAVKVTNKTDLKKMAQNTGISEDMMRKLNPGYYQMATTSVSPNWILVPASNVNAPAPQAVLAANTMPTVVEPVTSVQSLTEDAVEGRTIENAALNASTATPNDLVNAIVGQGRWVMRVVAQVSSFNGEGVAQVL